MLNNFLSVSYRLDEFAIIMIALVGYLGVCVAIFASRYMRGDTKYRLFFIHLIMLITSIVVMVGADNLGLLLISSFFSNILLVRLMIHKRNWKAAKASGSIAAKNYIFSAILMASAFAIFYFVTGEISVNAVIHQDAQSIPMLVALALLLIASMMQSAIWPFHRWLLSSLNSPTPVSAIMHAGLVNGGGFLLVRFAPLYLQHPKLLVVIFSIGIVTAFLGTLWKLMQSDVKRMLACSTMGQMGFMLVQCGLGLFPAAVAHLVWHGMFKAYLFLASGAAAQEKRFNLDYPPNPITFISALVCGAIGSFAFAYFSGKSWLENDTTLVLFVITFLAASQFSIPILRKQTIQSFLLAMTVVIFFGFIYGCNVHLIASMMEPMGIMQPQPLNGLVIMGTIALALAWLSIFFLCNQTRVRDIAPWMLKSYVKALNASQPYQATITAHHNHYQYQ